MLVGSSPLLSTLRAPGIRAQVRNGRMATSTTISSSNMTKSWVAIGEDVCPSLPLVTMTSPWAIMSSRWSAPASTPGWRLSKRRGKTSRTHFTGTHNGKQKWENASPTSSRTRSRKTRIGITYSRVSTLTRHSDRQTTATPSLGKEPLFTSGKFSVLFLYFIFLLSSLLYIIKKDA